MYSIYKSQVKIYRAIPRHPCWELYCTMYIFVKPLVPQNMHDSNNIYKIFAIIAHISDICNGENPHSTSWQLCFTRSLAVTGILCKADDILTRIVVSVIW